MNYDFMSWLDTPISDDSETIAAGRSEYLALHLSEIIQEIEKDSKVEALSEEEKATGLELLDKLIRFLTAANADLVLAIDRGGNCSQASDNDGATLNLFSKEVYKLACQNQLAVQGFKDLTEDLTIEFIKESDGRWIADVPNLPGVMAYGSTKEEATKEVRILTLLVLADMLRHDEVV